MDEYGMKQKLLDGCRKIYHQTNSFYSNYWILCENPVWCLFLLFLVRTRRIFIDNFACRPIPFLLLLPFLPRSTYFLSLPQCCSRLTVFSMQMIIFIISLILFVLTPTSLGHLLFIEVLFLYFLFNQFACRNFFAIMENEELKIEPNI